MPCNIVYVTDLEFLWYAGWPVLLRVSASESRVLTHFISDLSICIPESSKWADV